MYFIFAIIRFFFKNLKKNPQKIPVIVFFFLFVSGGDIDLVKVKLRGDPVELSFTENQVGCLQFIVGSLFIPTLQAQLKKYPI